MKIKVRPEDFLVEEEAEVPLAADAGPYAVYRLTKTSWDTFDLLDLLARRLGVPPGAVSVGGMKDRHGRTTQLFAVRGLERPPPRFADKNFQGELAGFTGGPLSARSVKGNRFTVVIRDMAPAEVRAARGNLDSLARFGVPNYYDEQRFGSARHGGGFMGKAIFLGRREEALRLYFLPSSHDDQKTRKLKKCVTASWGRWSECLPLAFGQYGRILTYLSAHPRAYHKALSLIERRFLVFVINAYQSFLFNEILRRRLASLAAEHGLPSASHRYAFGEFLFPASYPEEVFGELRGARLPVPGYDSSVADPAVRRILQEVLDAESIRLADLRVRQMQKLSAHGVERAALVMPEDLGDLAVSPDELYPGKSKAALSFFLPRGAYATIVLKRLFLRQASARAPA
jgi:tRNA pseudouridine13 synthase